MNIYLIGYRCTGKTSVGQHLANRLQWSFVDTDDEIFNRVMMPIAEIVARRGWPFFREQEKECLGTVSRLIKYVVATGGGVVTSIQNMMTMWRSGYVVWLKARPQTIYDRMITDDRSNDYRPALTGKKMLEEIEITTQNRYKYYTRAMDVAFDTDDLTTGTVVEKIIGHLGCLQ